MKIQDFAFLLVFALLFFRRDPRIFALAGIACLIISIPLFSLWVFFTAERLTWYAAAFFLASAILYLRVKHLD
ncbi:MAG: hypothetical protein Q8P80_00675 [Candidatus Levybacteria bacterium]|nr:hypothetical protein [Candidatus Levybacteria bacterium]